MAELCEDTGQGRVSSKVAAIIENHQTWKARNKEQRNQKVMQMELRKLGRDAEADEIGAPPAASANEGMSSAPRTSPPTEAAQEIDAALSTDPALADESGQGFDYSQMFQSTQSNVRVRVGPNGETIIDDQSLVVDRQEGREDTSNYTHVVESDQTKFTNSATYGRKGIKGHRWSAEETELFYHALSQFGENYEMIAVMLPGRDRKACKNKFKAEDKKDPARITAYLKNRIPIDMDALAKRTGKDFSGPTPVFQTPTPAAPPAQPATTQPAPSARSSQPPPSNASRKRSRTRTSGPEDGVQVLGSIDDPMAMPDD
jgi:transcription factor TFIIIB component B''